jgi:hypothetical protein
MKPVPIIAMLSFGEEDIVEVGSCLGIDSARSGRSIGRGDRNDRRGRGYSIPTYYNQPLTRSAMQHLESCSEQSSHARHIRMG